MTRNIWAREHLVSYLAGGLSTEERFEIQELLKSDADLAASLAELQGLDERVRKLFVAAKPALGFEDRVIRSLREKNVTAVRERRLKAPVKWFMIAASVLVVVAAGLLAVDQLATPLRMAASGTINTATEEAPPRSVLMGDAVNPPAAANFDRPDGEGGVDFDRVRRAQGRHNVELFDNSESLGVPDDLRKTAEGLIPIRQSTPGGQLLMKWKESGQRDPATGAQAWYREQKQPTANWGVTLDGSVHSGSNVDFGFVAPSQGGAMGGGGGGTPGRASGGDKSIADLTDSFGGARAGKGMEARGDRGALDALAEETRLKFRQSGARGFGLAASAPPVAKSLLEPKKDSPSEPSNAPARAGATFTVPLASRPEQPAAPPAAIPQPAAAMPAIQQSVAPPAEGFRPGDFFAKKSKDAGAVSGTNVFFNDADKSANTSQSGTTGSGTSRFDPNGLLLGGDKDGQKKQLDDKGKDLKEGQKDDGAVKSDKAEQKQPSPQKTEEKPPEANKAPEPKNPPTQRRIVIRSGDIEFEVDSFDQAVTTIYRLINLTKGGIVATTNSDKLANGKTRGAVVVRMPPEELDDFVLALRRDLGKNGELKGQKIGSQDVTKKYYDMESELRGLRVSEERLIAMMKDTKAKLSDLLAVETQLANTRTKIEHFEGELRYHANLAAMSTLTIQLNEKEIRVAAGVVESERVQAGVESEDVDKSFQEAKAAIDELKGRVFRSELKQSAAGQFNAILHFEIAPEQAGVMRDRLKQIGTVARLEIDRMQKVEGGGSPNLQSKVKRGDTQFLVNIYNLANVTPRETINARIVGNDVPGTFRKVRDLVVKLKGNLRNSSMVNSDSNNVVALLDFDVRRVDEPQVQAALVDAGEFLNRSVQRAAESDNVTDTKVRFSLRLESVASVTARETNALSMAALDVPESYRKVRDAVLKAKGHVRNANLQETDKLNITATLDFDVMRAEEAGIHTMLAGIGEITTRRTDRRPENESVTDAKVNFNVTMMSVAAMAARETTTLQLAATNVPEAYSKLRETVTKSKAQIRAANLQETDRQNMTAQLDFDVLRADEPAVLAALSGVGEQLTRRVERQSPNANVTDAKVAFSVSIVSIRAIEPRQTILIGIEVTNLEEKLKVIQALVNETQGRVVTGPTKEKNRAGQITADVTYDVPLMSASGLAEQIKVMGDVKVDDESKNPQAPDGKLAVARIRVVLATPNLLVPRDEGFGSQLRNWLSISLRGLSLTLSFLIAVTLFLAPWALIAWVAYRIRQRYVRNRETLPPTTPAPQPSQT